MSEMKPMTIEQTDNHAYICSKLAEQYKSDPVLFAALTDAAVIIRDLTSELRRKGYSAITHCDKCGCDWLDNGLNPIGCPYCELRDVLREAVQACRELDDEALEKEGRLACGSECASAITDLAARWNVHLD